jgi:hypothetical protein
LRKLPGVRRTPNPLLHPCVALADRLDRGDVRSGELWRGLWCVACEHGWIDTGLSPLEAERNLAAAAARHSEAVASLAQGGRPASAETSAIRAVARGVQLVTYALGRAHAAGIDVERLAVVSGWEPDVVREALDRGPEPVLGRVVPDSVDPDAVTLAAAALEASTHVEQLLRRISGDVHDDSWSPAPADLDDLHDRLEIQWQSWRSELGRRT